MTANAKKSQANENREADFAFLRKSNREGESNLDYKQGSINFFEGKLVESTRPNKSGRIEESRYRADRGQEVVVIQY